MRLKEESQSEIFINGYGQITIKQYDFIQDTTNIICLSPIQFEKFKIWVETHQNEIDDAWNEGIDFEGVEDEN